MKQISNALFLSSLLTGSVSFAKVNSNQMHSNKMATALSEKALVEELTGKKVVSEKQPRAIQNVDLKKAPLSVQHLIAGQNAAAQKNYILAIKHLNTVIKKYPQSAQVQPALIEKANIYKEMGLQDQAQHNLKLAELKTAKNVKPSTAMATSQEKTKTVK